MEKINEGSVEVLDRDINRYTPKDFPKIIFYVPQFALHDINMTKAYSDFLIILKNGKLSTFLNNLTICIKHEIFFSPLDETTTGFFKAF